VVGVAGRMVRRTTRGVCVVILVEIKMSLMIITLVIRGGG
jgi:hypothetical protein